MALKGAAADVAGINVEGGMLVLCGAETNGVHSRFDTGVGEIDVHVPNHSFEMPFTVSGSSNNGKINASSTIASNGWYAIGGHSVHFITANRSAGTGYSTWAAYPPPDGEQALLLRGAASAETDVTIPRAGTYELSFFANSRYGIGTTASPATYAIYKPLEYRVEIDPSKIAEASREKRVVYHLYQQMMGALRTAQLRDAEGLPEGGRTDA